MEKKVLICDSVTCESTIEKDEEYYVLEVKTRNDERTYDACCIACITTIINFLFKELESPGDLISIKFTEKTRLEDWLIS